MRCFINQWLLPVVDRSGQQLFDLRQGKSQSAIEQDIEQAPAVRLRVLPVIVFTTLRRLQQTGGVVMSQGANTDACPFGQFTYGVVGVELHPKLTL